jgi:hypothetical protein
MIPDLKHMDIGSRNQRLRETLEGMGLFVLPIYSESDLQRIDYLQVSADLPSYVRKGVAEVASRPSVAVPVPSSDIPRNVRTTESLRDNVVNLPTAQ